ncbi:ABC transporter permease [Bartonella sp. HY761]|uniref:ABC transporter permease n=1 Tax=Bartonella sp. HY761 TaxID=2979330 RepID=UPI0021FF98C2|nr:ABC transporter permease [Bartonella sp. HY761]UXN06258.1 ABC transporter permease [Bartonella sp. HY761]
MLRYSLNRLGQALIVLWAAFTASFILLQVMPGDAALLKFLNPEYGLNAQQIEELRGRYGFDQPVFLQYLKSLSNFLHGDLGFSIQAGVPVTEQLVVNLPPTLQLAGFAFLAAIILAFLLTLLSSFSPFAWLKNLFLSLPSLFLAVPLFWIGIIMVQVFSFELGWISVIAPGPIEGLILPIATLAIPISAPMAQILMRAMDEIETRPFIMVLQAKGASKWRIFWQHGLRNAALPTLTVAGLLFGELISGAVVTETVFGLSGIGKMTEQAVRSQDVTVLQAIVVISALAFVTINLLIDLSFPFIDPRLKKSQGKAA